jgi:membrane-associated protein
MTDWLLALVPQYGLWLLFFVTLFSCLALPLPASIMMLTAGGFAAAGDFLLWQALLAALAGAVLGDQIGYWAGRSAGRHIAARRKTHPTQDTLITKAEQMMAKGGIVSIFLTRWMFSAIGPYVNVTAGSLKFTWVAFTIAGIAGEMVWSSLYVGMGYGFAGNLDAASDLLGSILGFVGAGAAVIILGYLLFKLLKSER